MVERSKHMMRYAGVTPEMRPELRLAAGEFQDSITHTTRLRNLNPQVAKAQETIPQTLLEHLEQKLSSGILREALTSELVYLSKTSDDDFAKEHRKRLRLIGISDRDIEHIYTIEKMTLHPDINQDYGRDHLWAKKNFWPNGLHPSKRPNPGGLTLSELILTTHDIVQDFTKKHTASPEVVQQALPYAQNYFNPFNQRTKTLCLSPAQARAYAANEIFIANRVRECNRDILSWTPETTNPEQYMD